MRNYEQYPDIIFNEDKQQSRAIFMVVFIVIKMQGVYQQDK